MRRSGLTGRLRNWLFGAAVRFRQAEAESGEETVNWRTSTSGWGLRFTERLRDHWRRRWLRLRRDAEE